MQHCACPVRHLCGGQQAHRGLTLFLLLARDTHELAYEQSLAVGSTCVAHGFVVGLGQPHRVLEAQRLSRCQLSLDAPCSEIQLTTIRKLHDRCAGAHSNAATHGLAKGVAHLRRLADRKPQRRR